MIEATGGFKLIFNSYNWGLTTTAIHRQGTTRTSTIISAVSGPSGSVLLQSGPDNKWAKKTKYSTGSIYLTRPNYASVCQGWWQ